MHWQTLWLVAAHPQSALLETLKREHFALFSIICKFASRRGQCFGIPESHFNLFSAKKYKIVGYFSYILSRLIGTGSYYVTVNSLKF